MATDRKEEIRRIDEALEVWRQGDCALGKHWFVHRFAPALPLTEEAMKIASEAEAAGQDLAESEVPGLMIASQSCDVVRSCAERPFVEVCPLVQQKFQSRLGDKHDKNSDEGRGLQSASRDAHSRPVSPLPKPRP